MSTRIVRLDLSEWERLRAVRLRALEDAPDAFASTLEETTRRPAEEWEQQLRKLPTFVAMLDGRDVGMVRMDDDRHRADAAWLISLWVAPEARGRGLGRDMVAQVIDLARQSGKERLLLDVADNNVAAIRLYEQAGFRRNGVVSTLPTPRAHITEHQRELPLV